MTRLKPRKWDRVAAIFGAIDSKFSTNREDPNDTKIQELENQMDDDLFCGKRKVENNTQKNFPKSFNKTHKGLR